MTHDDMAELHRRVHAAQEVVDRPWIPGETSRPYEFFTDHLADDGWRLGWKLVAAIRQSHPELFLRSSEEELHSAALEFVLAAETAPSPEDVTAGLLETVADDAVRLVSTPLANMVLDRTWAPLGPNAALWRPDGSDETPDAEARDEDAAIQSAFAVRRHLGDQLRAAPRVLRLSSGRTIDTRRTVTLISKEEGPPDRAVSAARAKARYALATWTILSPPDRWHLSPELSIWSPQPYLYQYATHKRYESDRWHSRDQTEGGGMREWAPYPLPNDEILVAPFEAFAAIDRRSAQALLSATAALDAAQRASRASLSEQIRSVRAAVECLCEPAPGERGALKRWERLATRLRVWDEIARDRAYTPSTITALQSRLIDARNISAHGADAALIDIGWSAGDRPLDRGRIAEESDLAANALRRDLGPMKFAVGEALRALWPKLRVAEFDDDVFEDYFASENS